MRVDYHIHTKLCGHADGEMEEYVEQAIAAGLDEMGFSDHMPMEVWGRHDPTLTMRLQDMIEYHDRVKELRHWYRDRIRIKFGIEADYVPGKEREIGDFLREWNFDYVIGSVHFLGDWGFDDPRYMEGYERRGVDNVYYAFFKVIRMSAESGLFDIIGHADLVKKFGHRPERDLKPEFDDLAASFARSGVAVEINTSGLRKPVGEIYPHPALVRACREYGVPVIATSDAHTPGDVGRDLHLARKLAVDSGHSRSFTLTGRKRDIHYDLQP
ncbi:MAG: Histidinol-phosphatase [Myxococcota bacterium]|nr:Histidinol-phosphatase [Myxococcota bacterium]